MRMKKTALHKDIYRTITGTLPRFLSIFFIVVLGVAFYSGIRVTQKDMYITADHQFDGSRLMDVKVMGTLGISEENLTALRKVKKCAVGRRRTFYSDDCKGSREVTKNMRSKLWGRLIN